MTFALTQEHKAKYRENRRRKYATDPEYRAKVQARNRAKNAANRERYNEARRLRMQDPQYRAAQSAKRKALYRKRPEIARHHQLRAHYGIDLQQYNAMLAAQGGVCAICRKPSDKTLHVDHNHETGAVRELLCTHCNRGLGCYLEDTETMKRAIAYLEKHGGH